jgi:hypothetical protein
MKRIFPLVFLVVWGLPLQAQQPFDATLAAVRIKSHGASGTVIGTTKGKTWILSCCHMFMGHGDQLDAALLQKRLVMDGPQQPDAVIKGVAGSRVLAYDAKLDLSLIELDNGPFYCIPVAPAGHKPGPLVSVGYDSMKWPVTLQPATFVGSAGNTTYTREKPWHGRSGGALIDVQGRVLIGVVQGYEVGGGDRGLYVSLEAVRVFLKRHRPALLQIQIQVPAPSPKLYYPFPGPGGVCPPSR